jgi:hypothetical protein
MASTQNVNVSGSFYFKPRGNAFGKKLFPIPPVFLKYVLRQHFPVGHYCAHSHSLICPEMTKKTGSSKLPLIHDL